MSNATPPIGPGQFETGDIGRLSRDVNLFRGDVNYPQKLVQLPGVPGDDTLAVGVALHYRSNVSDQVTQWNLDAPTGIAGLGWYLAWDRIEAVGTGSVSAATRYVYWSAGVSNALVADSTPWPRVSLDAAATATLAVGTVSADVVAAFAAQGVPLDAGATVAGGGTDWTISDDTWERVFSVATTGTGAEVCDGGSRFQLQDYEFWQISYYADYEKWEITTDSGEVRTFGGGLGRTAKQYATSAGNSVEWAVKWGGPSGTWTGPSTMATDQQQYARAWNLSTRRDRWGSSVSYAYNEFPRGADGLLGNNAEQLVGTGLPYTKAIYPTSITSVAGQVVTFRYGDKTFTADAQEYLDPHKQLQPAGAPETPPADLGAANAYQDRYETLYLSGLEVSASTGAPLFAVDLDYTAPRVVSTTPAELSATAVKRYLAGVSERNAAGATLPGYAFDYYVDAADGPNLGALRSVTHPQGAVATWSYAESSLDVCDRATPDIAPAAVLGAGATPLVWSGADYVVSVWLNAERTMATLDVYTWLGRWSHWSGGTVYDDQDNPLDAGDTQVVTGDDTFALALVAEDDSQSHVTLCSRTPTRPDQWAATGVPALTGVATLTAGSAFIAAVLADGSSYDLYRWAWDWRTGWSGTDEPVQSGSSPLFALGAAECLLVAETSVDGTDVSLAWLDGYATWHDGDTITLPGHTVGDNDDHQVLWDAGPSVAALSFAEGQPGMTYGVQLLRWDLTYHFTDTAYAGGLQAEPIDSDQPVSWPPQPEVVDGAFVAVRQNLFRFDAGTWHSTSFATSGQGCGWLAFAYGDDVAVQVVNDYTDAATELMAYDPDGDGFAAQPTPITTALPQGGDIETQGWPSASGGDFIVARNSVFYRGTSTTWAEPVRQPVFALTSTSQLATDVDSRSIVNQAPAFLAYLVSDAAVAADDAVQLLVLRNGGVLQPLPDTLGSSAYYVPGVSPGSADGQWPAGPFSLVAYAATEGGFSQAASYRVYRYAGQAMSGPVTAYPVSTLVIGDGFGATYTTAYEFDAATAACDPTGQVVKYYRSAVYDGAADARTSAFGRTVYSYLNGTLPGASDLCFDGLLRQTAAFAGAFTFATAMSSTLGLDPDAAPGPPQPVPDGLAQAFAGAGSTLGSGATLQYLQIDGAYRYWAVADPASGQVYNIDYTGDPSAPDAVRVFTGTPVHSRTTTWTLFDQRGRSPQDPAPQPIYGTYVRPAEVVERRDGVPMTTTLDYATIDPLRPFLVPAPFSGGVVGRGWQLTTITGSVETHAERLTYGYEQYPGLLAANLLKPVVAALHTVSVDGAATVTVSSTATTWSSWSQPGTGLSVMAAARQWAWTGDPSGGDDGSFPFDGTPDPAYWVTTSTATAVSARGAVSESADPAGTVHATLASADGLLDIAHVANASFTAGQAAYTGFETYEDLTGWTLTGGADWDDTDAHTGSSSLALPGAGAAATRAALSPKADQTYVFTAWCKTGAGFTPGTSGWTFTVTADGTPASQFLPFPDTGGAWAPQSAAIAVPAGGDITLTIAAANTTTAAVHADDVTVVPLTAQFTARSYDAASRLPLARIDRAGHTWHMIRDTFLRVIGGTTSTGAPSSLQLKYLSRQGNPDGFDCADPNGSLAVRCFSGGSHQTFRDGTGWQADWTPSAATAFTAAGGVLAHQPSAQSDSLGHAAPPGPTYALYVELAPLGDGPLQLTDDFAITAGDDAAVTFDPATTQWRLTLDGTPAGSPVSVTGPPTWCLLVLIGGRLIFYADGRQLFAEQTQAGGAPAVVVGRNGLAIANLVLLDGPALRLKHSDATGAARQDHILTNEDYLVSQTIRDGRARKIARTEPAPGLFGGGASLPVLAYRGGLVDVPAFLAGLDGDATMTGDVADWYDGTHDTDDGGYPYTRTVLEPARHARPVELGFPGIDHAVIDRGSTTPAARATVQFGYDANEEALPYGLNPPDATFRLTTRTGQTKTAMTTLRDASGRPAARYTPAGADAALDTVAPQYANGTADTVTALPDSYTYSEPAQSLTHRENAVGQVVEDLSPDTGTTRYLFDRGGRVRFVQDAAAAAAGLFAYHTWDVLGRRLSSGTVTLGWDSGSLQQYADEPSWPEDQTETPYQVTRRWTYDGDGGDLAALDHVVGTVAVTGSGASSYEVAESFGWAPDGTLASRTVRMSQGGSTLGTFTTTYEFDNQGRATRVGYPCAAATGLTAVRYTFDGRDNIVGVADDGGTLLASYVYDPRGRPVTHTYPGGCAGAASYDPLGRLGSLAVTSGETALSLELTYDAAGNPQTLVESISGDGVKDTAAVRYSHDPLQRLLSADDADGTRTVGVGYTTTAGLTDQNGNIQTLARGGGDPARFGYAAGTNRLTSVTPTKGSPATYTYQANGLLSRRGGDDLTLTYLDATALPATITGGTGGTTLTFAYDVNGYRRVKQSAGDDTPALYVHAGTPGPLLTVDASGTPTAWVYGPTGLVAMTRGGLRHTIVTDHLRSPRLVLDGDSTLVAAYSFDVFGRQVLAHEPSPGFVPMLFTGQELDAETGLYAFPARLYDPSIARFLNPDPAGQYASPYVYAGNQPALLTDPTGAMTAMGEAGIEAALTLLILATAIATAGATAALVPAAFAAEGVFGGLAAAAATGAGIGAAGGGIMGAAGSGLEYAVTTPPGNWSGKAFGLEFGIGLAAGAAGGLVTGGISGGLSSMLEPAAAAGAAAAPGAESAEAAGAAEAAAPPLAQVTQEGGGAIDEVAPTADAEPPGAQQQAGAAQERAPAPARPASAATRALQYAKPGLVRGLIAVTSGGPGGAVQGAVKQVMCNVAEDRPLRQGVGMESLVYLGFGMGTSLLGVVAQSGAEWGDINAGTLKTAWTNDPWATVAIPALPLVLLGGGYLCYTNLRFGS
ncbi:RHS repeat domain-containing protein [Nonomuraea spiralis]|uniref:RHS repeat domain-containing protein n=1 Tax=Nonomuraea spiralis TaxID=46182 RepID=A0ABV5IFX8_9ACTN|nr:RHS repeat-associated core domain-containing protein [Nonomuraea spiralis]